MPRFGRILLSLNSVMLILKYKISFFQKYPSGHFLFRLVGYLWQSYHLLFVINFSPGNAHVLNDYFLTESWFYEVYQRKPEKDVSSGGAPPIWGMSPSGGAPPTWGTSPLEELCPPGILLQCCRFSLAVFEVILLITKPHTSRCQKK